MAYESTIHVIDDDPAIRDSLSLLLTTEGHEVRTHESAQSFLEAIGEGENGCVVTVVRMPGLSGLDLIEKMRKRHISMPIIVITGHADIPLAVQAMKQGAVDFLEKPFDEDALLASIQQVLRCKNNDTARKAKVQSILSKLATLTRRENEVLAGLLKGQSNKVIAHELYISVRTVEVHRAMVMAKMEARSLPELVRIALVVPREDSGF
ncbi:MAG TPA: response regulator FixJ [Methylocella sp.]|jgi:two-component system response regulator FixJ